MISATWLVAKFESVASYAARRRDRCGELSVNGGGRKGECAERMVRENYRGIRRKD
jgi:hypothetical protein